MLFLTYGSGARVATCTKIRQRRRQTQTLIRCRGVPGGEKGLATMLRHRVSPHAGGKLGKKKKTGRHFEEATDES